jgi:hypothetical protein
VVLLIENILAGYIAQKLLPLEKIKVKELGKSATLFSHSFLFYLDWRNFIKIQRLSNKIALALTDFKKAWIYRLRSSL